MTTAFNANKAVRRHGKFRGSFVVRSVDQITVTKRKRSHHKSFGWLRLVRCYIVRRSSEGSSSQEQLTVDGIASELADGIDTTCSTTASTPQQHDSVNISTEEFDVEAASNNQNTLAIGEPVVGSSESDEMKRAHAKQLIEKYFYQLSDGCGNPNCTNRNCASSGEVDSLTPNQAAARAIQLFSEEAPLCSMPSTKLMRIAANDEPAPVLVNSNASNVAAESQSMANTVDTELTKTNDAYR